MNEQWCKIADILAALYGIIFAPFLWMVLLAQAVCQIRRKPKDLEVSKLGNWPSSIAPPKKASIIKARKAATDSYLEMIQGKSFYFPDRCANEVQWEDPLERLVGKRELVVFADLWSRMVKALEVEKEVHGEHHGSDATVLDLTITGHLTALPSMKLPMRMRTYFTFDSDERVTSVTEHWGGNPLLDVTNVNIIHCPFFSRIGGNMHMNQRRLQGYLLAKMHTQLMELANACDSKKSKRKQK